MRKQQHRTWSIRRGATGNAAQQKEEEGWDEDEERQGEEEKTNRPMATIAACTSVWWDRRAGWFSLQYMSMDVQTSGLPMFPRSSI